VYLSYGDIIQTLSLIVEVAILVYVVKEFRHLTTDVHEIKEAPNRTVFGVTDDLNVGDKVHVVEPRPGVAREDWRYKPELYVIRAVDKVGNKAMATRVSPSVQGPTPTVVGPARGEHSPFKKASVPG
jgi:hypothetical protein